LSRSDAISSAEYAAELARGAGELLLDVRASIRPDELGTSALGSRGDRAAQDYLNARLSRERAGDAVLSEEAPDSIERLSARRVWIIDPLDGTREFSEGRHDWAVHVALWEDDELVVGAVALPALGEVHSSADEQLMRPPRTARMRLAVSRSRPPAIARHLAETLDLDLVPLGSAGFKAMAVVRGDAEAYLHAGGQYEWDSAAPVAVARRAGLVTSRIDGRALRYNRPNPYLPDLLVCIPAVADDLLGAISDYLKGGARE
jgi:3'(2'), 5'-bisphosphate nucleotidase